MWAVQRPVTRMTIRNSARKAIVEQFERPRGPLGALVGLVMRVRPSNRIRSIRTLELLDIRPEDRVLEVGFGPGLAVARAAERATTGKVVGVDHSPLMLRQARRRNAQAIRAGRVELLLGSADALPRFEERFDKILAVNVHMFWKDPASVLTNLRSVTKPGGVIALTLQPRNRGATMDDTQAAAKRMAASLEAAGFGEIRTEILEIPPVAAACVLGRNPVSPSPLIVRTIPGAPSAMQSPFERRAPSGASRRAGCADRRRSPRAQAGRR
jgi:SAM-dependent methyltransferase